MAPWGVLGELLGGSLGGPKNEMSGLGRIVLDVRLIAHAA